jgi:predicted HTH transcriptional regulator
MPEQQNIEYKQSWHYDYLKWVCGFANVQGGLIFIGNDDYINIVRDTDFNEQHVYFQPNQKKVYISLILNSLK